MSSADCVYVYIHKNMCIYLCNNSNQKGVINLRIGAWERHGRGLRKKRAGGKVMQFFSIKNSLKLNKSMQHGCTAKSNNKKSK